MLLCDIIPYLENDESATAVVRSLGDPGLLMAMQAVADDMGVSLGTYAAWAVRAYADNAPAEDWTTMLGALERSASPGREWLHRALATVVAGTVRSPTLADEP